MGSAASSRQAWALGSAAFAALTAIFAKVGVEGINADLATFIRTTVVLMSYAMLLFATDQFAVPSAMSSRSWLFLILSGLATGLPRPAGSALRSWPLARS